jgi:uncharacterized membrane protein YcaP (DUF421 family)
MAGVSSPDWSAVFAPDLSLFESFARWSVVYLALVVLFRVVLKRQSGSLGLPYVMLVVLVSECVSNALSATANSVPNALVAVLALLFWNYALDRLACRWPWFHRLLEPAPLELVKDGRPIRANLDAEGVSDAELSAQLRQNGVDDVAKVKSAVMESEGSVSVIERVADRPATTADPDAPPDVGAAVERFAAAVERLRAAVEWHERRAAGHRDAAKAARGLLRRTGVRTGRTGSPAPPQEPPDDDASDPAREPAPPAVPAEARPRLRDGPQAEVPRPALQGVRQA